MPPALSMAALVVLFSVGVSRLLFLDMRRAGIAEGVIMKIGGWRTRSVFECYAIVSQTDIQDAMQKLKATERTQKA